MRLTLSMRGKKLKLHFHMDGLSLKEQFTKMMNLMMKLTKLGKKQLQRIRRKSAFF